MTIALYMIMFFLFLIELDLSNIACHLKSVEALNRSSERIDNRLYAIERKMGKEVEEWEGGEIGKCSKCGHEGCSSDIWNGIHGDCYCPKCGRKVNFKEDEDA